ncbi:F0F1 ATP synthase subunit delta [Alkaliphilus oremlandii]|uniref:ATP synthase subunit delta n=1 Tax=Alkaliphilus oremlandii (strain OhILAs) TaxID=350688 RepID=ATPD_ALKOO|nr:F0F1 ATP synthase subunit delta [Alkaliphilus oremlandii]A8MJW2.1 RecName: Full=ATP synthase subunit delta; AltName: Full=ATP synthase F(1) sector subunit delta; AltName: Full=F-type ATPase subunit delta; Short=F-ATPase subunit delta [Alkaliphilus oremlandii OhILAs]ABW20094.1 ATP synthase F1, delta subunit [Alkaliphilus oremlandii OhILAs]
MAELVSKRYASALFELAFEEQKHHKVQEELAFIRSCIEDEPSFFELLKSPLITADEKKDIISNIFRDRVCMEVLNFLYIIIDKGREAYIKDIVNEYILLVDSVQNKVDAVAITAVPMEKQDLLMLQANLSKSSGKNIQLQNQVDPTIIGGVLVKIGDKVIDGTIKNRLATMQEQLSKILV